jgi:hypothetical protein
MLSFYSFFESIVPFKRKGRAPATSAGCFFTDGNLYLAGYQPNKKIPCISGIGGNPEEGETEIETAFRELIEELFEISPVPREMQKDLEMNVQPSLRMCNEGYTILQFTFKDLETILERMSKFDPKSKLYQEFPMTVGDLVLKRIVCSKAEISHLVLLPFVSNTPFDTSNFLSTCLLSDVNLLRGLFSVKNPLA